MAAGSEAEVEKQLQRAVYMRRLRTAFVVQDLADSSMAISDLTGGRLHPAVVALAGLVSGSVSFYKNWNA